MRRRSRATLAAVVVAAASAAALGGWALRGGAERRDERPVLGHAELPEVAGYEGRMTLERGELLVRLGPLHADPERQAFDAKALAARLGLGAGEPWRLEVAFTPKRAYVSEVLAVDGLAIVARGAPAGAEPLVRPIAAAERASASTEPADPLRTLFAAPASLRVDLARGASLVLWGTARGEALELRWLGRSTVLEARRWSADPLQDVLARVGPDDAGEAAGERADGASEHAQDEERGR